MPNIYVKGKAALFSLRAVFWTQRVDARALVSPRLFIAPGHGSGRRFSSQAAIAPHGDRKLVTLYVTSWTVDRYGEIQRASTARLGGRPRRRAVGRPCSDNTRWLF
jgi:hypothetical protein